MEVGLNTRKGGTETPLSDAEKSIYRICWVGNTKSVPSWDVLGRRHLRF